VSIGGLVSSGPPAAQQLPGEQAAMIAALQASHGGLSSLADGPHGGLIERHAHLSGTHISQAEVTVAALQRLAALEAWPEMCRVEDLEWMMFCLRHVSHDINRESYKLQWQNVTLTARAGNTS
jgi:hypothetical protein